MFNCCNKHYSKIEIQAFVIGFENFQQKFPTNKVSEHKYVHDIPNPNKIRKATAPKPTTTSTSYRTNIIPVNQANQIQGTQYINFVRVFPLHFIIKSVKQTYVPSESVTSDHRSEIE